MGKKLVGLVFYGVSVLAGCSLQEENLYYHEDAGSSPKILHFEPVIKSLEREDFNNKSEKDRNLENAIRFEYFKRNTA